MYYYVFDDVTKRDETWRNSIMKVLPLYTWKKPHVKLPNVYFIIVFFTFYGSLMYKNYSDVKDR